MAKIKKQLVFETRLLERAENKAVQLGVSFPEYVRHLILIDTAPLDYPVTEDELTQIRENMEAYEKGDYVTLKTEADIDEFFRKLDD